jgi:hypothetical protein
VQTKSEDETPSEEDLLKKRCSERIEEMLTKDEFIVTEEIRDEILHGDFKYPDFFDDSLRMLLSKILESKSHELLKGEHKDKDWEIQWNIHFFTSPKQLKLIFRDRIQNYPCFSLGYMYSEPFGNGSKGIGGFKLIEMGHCLSLIRHYKHEWLVGKEMVKKNGK